MTYQASFLAVAASFHLIASQEALQQNADQFGEDDFHEPSQGW